VPGIPVADTIKVVDGSGVVTATPPRASLVAVQTPQAFSAAVLRRAHATGGEGTDDASLVEAMGGKVVVVPGDPTNRKITLPEDLVWARSVVGDR
jgi:2-C-methyl-D-erythritol 4-phosphate cytidylyltransferase